MWCHKADEFTGRNDFGLLPELGKMPAITCHKVIGAGFVSAFKKDIVVRVTAHVQEFCRQEAEKESKILRGSGCRAWFIGRAPERS